MSDSDQKDSNSTPPGSSGDAGSYGFDKIQFPQNECIFDEGDDGDCAYLIVSGKIEIRKGVKTSNPQPLATLGKGDVFGEMALFDDSPRMAQAVATTNVEAIRIARSEFMTRLETVDPVMRTTILYMVQRVRDMADDFMRRKGGAEWHQWRKDKKKPDFYK
ncbi:MAG: cyclic nucleotide-binding domain-containing protein [Rhodospirillaceae bacterium]|nr:cyclic nucleotide-binding domain-containing protein [Rhodospirillaceae bacterium]